MSPPGEPERPDAGPSAHSQGIALALAAYAWWGLSPLFWKQLTHVPAAATLSWRVVATFVLLVVYLAARGQLGGVLGIVRDPAARRVTAASGVLIAVNWVVYLWAVNVDRVSEASLGYFIYPLVSVLLGVRLLGEHLRPLQWTAVGLAALGVAWLTVDVGAVPWVALTLAASFGGYGLIRKLRPVGAFDGLTYETGILLVPCLAVLAVWDGGANLTWGAGTMLLLAASGVFTAVPLVLFAAAAPRVPLSLIGLLQYVNPFLQLALGVLVYDEVFDRGRLVGYAIIWLGLALLLVDGLRSSSALDRRPAVPVET